MSNIDLDVYRKTADGWAYTKTINRPLRLVNDVPVVMFRRAWRRIEQDGAANVLRLDDSLIVEGPCKHV